MATVSQEELAKQFADQVRRAFNSRYSTKSASGTASEKVAALSSIADAIRAEIRDIAQTLDTIPVVVSPGVERPLTEAEKERIGRLAGQDLGLDDAEDFYQSTKSASNNSFMELQNHVSQIIRDLLKKKG